MVEELEKTVSTVPLTAWFGLAGVVIGSIISIFGVWFTNKSNTTRLQMQLLHERQSRNSDKKRERLEELYVLVGHWLNGLAGHYLSLSSVMQGKLDYNQHLDLFINQGNNNKHDFNQLEMILNVYAHELKPEYDKVIEARTELNEISRKHKQAYEQGDIDSQQFLQPYIEAQLKIESLGERLQKQIAEYAKSV